MGDQPGFKHIIYVIRFVPRPLRPLGQDIARFIYLLGDFDSGFVRFGDFSAGLDCRNFQIFRIFNTIFMYGFIADNSIFCHMFMIELIQLMTEVFDQIIFGKFVQLFGNQPFQSLLDPNKRPYFVGFLACDEISFGVFQTHTFSTDQLIDLPVFCKKAVLPTDSLRKFTTRQGIRDLFRNARFSKQIYGNFGYRNGIRQYFRFNDF